MANESTTSTPIDYAALDETSLTRQFERFLRNHYTQLQPGLVADGTLTDAERAALGRASVEEDAQIRGLAPMTIDGVLSAQERTALEASAEGRDFIGDFNRDMRISWTREEMIDNLTRYAPNGVEDTNPPAPEPAPVTAAAPAAAPSEYESVSTPQLWQRYQEQMNVVLNLQLDAETPYTQEKYELVKDARLRFFEANAAEQLGADKITLDGVISTEERATFNSTQDTAEALEKMERGPIRPDASRDDLIAAVERNKAFIPSAQENAEMDKLLPLAGTIIRGDLDALRAHLDSIKEPDGTIRLGTDSRFVVQSTDPVQGFDVKAGSYSPAALVHQIAAQAQIAPEDRRSLDALFGPAPEAHAVAAPTPAQTTAAAEPAPAAAAPPEQQQHSQNIARSARDMNFLLGHTNDARLLGELDKLTDDRVPASDKNNGRLDVSEMYALQRLGVSDPAKVKEIADLLRGAGASAASDVASDAAAHAPASAPLVTPPGQGEGLIAR